MKFVPCKIFTFTGVVIFDIFSHWGIATGVNITGVLRQRLLNFKLLHFLFSFLLAAIKNHASAASGACRQSLASEYSLKTNLLSPSNQGRRHFWKRYIFTIRKKLPPHHSLGLFLNQSYAFLSKNKAGSIIM